MTLQERRATIWEKFGFPDEHRDNKSGDLIDDIETRISILLYKSKKKEIETLSKKLNDLRSEELRVTDELDELAALLKLKERA
jgi:hypothetical protein